MTNLTYHALIWENRVRIINLGKSQISIFEKVDSLLEFDFLIQSYCILASELVFRGKLLAILAQISVAIFMHCDKCFCFSFMRSKFETFFVHKLVSQELAHLKKFHPVLVYLLQLFYHFPAL